MNGKYTIERRLGGGGMAEVFLARAVGAEGFSRPVAIKRVLPGFSDNPQFAQMFISEAQLSSQLQHSNLVSVLDFDRDIDGHLFLVMELVDGIDLDGLLKTGPLPFSLVIFLAVEILRGLDYAHELPSGTDGVRGVVHRDISPHNILLAWDGGVKLADFGIAKVRAATNVTASVLIKGKPSFMSPEQARGWPLDGRSDLFSVGVMLFEMLCLKPLFAGNTTEETLFRLFSEPIPLPQDLRPEIPEDLSRVVVSLLERDRDQRMPSANAAIAALVACADYPRDGRDEVIATLSQRFAGRAPVRAREVSRRSHSDSTLVARPESPAVSAIPAASARRTITAPSALRLGPKHRRQRWWMVLAGVLLCGATGVVVVSARSTSPVAAVKPTTSEVAPAVPRRPALLDVPSTAPRTVEPGPGPTTGATQLEPKPAPGVAPPESKPVRSGSVDGSTLSAPQAPSAAPAGDRASASSVLPGRHAESVAPKPGILEIHL